VSALGERVRGRLEPRAARGYGAGGALADARALAERLGAAGVPVTIGYWDGPGAPAAGALDAALAAVEGGPVRAGVAVKAPALLGAAPRDLAAVGDHLARRAAATGRALTVDAHATDQADAALALARRVHAGGADARCALPGRWRRSAADAEAALDAGLGLRLVKGQWPDPGDPDRDPAAGVLELVDRVAGRARHVAVATHDPALAAAALARLTAAGTPCELELLLGLPVRDVARAARGVLDGPPRVYVPWGARGLPYEAALRGDPRLLVRLLADALAGPRRHRRTLALAG
jgi:proline dehydrogenase